MSEYRYSGFLRALPNMSRMTAKVAIDNAPDGSAIIIKPATRTIMQNSRMWAQLADVSAQVVWHGRKLSSEEWKCVFSASLKRQDVVPGIDSGFVVMAQSTSRMTKAELSSLMELIGAFGNERGVKWSNGE